MGKQTIILVTKNLPPDVGGMETMWLNVVKELSNTVELHVIAPKKCQKSVEGYGSFHATPNRFPLFIFIAALKACYLATFKKAQFVLAGSGTTLLPAALAGLMSKAKPAVYLHGLDIIYPNRVYKLQFKILVQKMQQVFVNSENTKQLAVDSGIKESVIYKILPATNGWQLPQAIEPRFKLNAQNLNIIYFGRIIPRKGLLEFIDNCFQVLLTQHPEAQLHIAGEDINSNQNEYVQDVVKAANRPEFKAHTHFWGKLQLEELIQLASQCDVNIFPLVETNGDVEGFGIVILEADSIALPTIAFDCGGVRDAVKISQYGQLVVAGDYTEFGKQVLDVFGAEREAKMPSQDWSNFSSLLLQSLSTVK